MREVADSGGPRDRLFAVAALAVLIGTTAESSTEDATGSQGIGQAIGRLGGHDSPVADDLGLTFLILTLLIALISTGQISAMRTEEADGHLENLLVRPVSRTSWFAGRLGLSALLLLLLLLLLLVAGVLARIGAWAGAASQHSGARLGSLVTAGLNVVAPAPSRVATASSRTNTRSSSGSHSRMPAGSSNG